MSLISLAVVAAGSVATTATAGGVVDERSVAQIWNERLLDAIRINFPHPPLHARNLWHSSLAMWDAWAAYDPDASGYLFNEKHTAVDTQAAREEAISYAVYNLLASRFTNTIGSDITLAALRQQMIDLGYDPDNHSVVGDTPDAVGNRIFVAINNFGLTDGSNQLGNYAPTNGYAPVNSPLILELPGTQITFPNRWQPLAFDYFVTQNGIPIGTLVQEFLGPHWGGVKSWTLPVSAVGVPIDPGTPPHLGGVGDAQYKAEATEVIQRSSTLDPSLPAMLDISPYSHHNNSLGMNDGTGYGTNPITGLDYVQQIVPLGDYSRCLAEFWADGPSSETPPGHWSVIANDLHDNPAFEYRLFGKGDLVDRLEWDVKLYMAVDGAVHDAACAAWGCKNHYDYVRPISMIRHMCGLGQSSDPMGASYDPDGIPLQPGLIELITEESSAAGQRHEHLADHIGEIAIYCWAGAPEDTENDFGGVDWILGINWFPYQKATFVTPSFAGYVSGHSAFSRAAAEVLASITGSPFFPGGLGEYHFKAHQFLEFEDGPSVDITLQWATYYDASDEAGISRLYGGIHVPSDDGPGRRMGSICGKRSIRLAQRYWAGTGDFLPDLNNDGVVETGDIAMLIKDFGQAGDDLTADLNLDGVVDTADLGEMILMFGQTQP
ncbi:MAG: hypothetical protein H6814_11130 [Phycisphaeraceae bacterium]|nr:hypothetical protein [Phycisphaeraceae bacterium]